MNVVNIILLIQPETFCEWGGAYNPMIIITTFKCLELYHYSFKKLLVYS